MATAPIDDDEPLELTDEAPDEEPPVETPDNDEQDEDGETVIGFADEQPEDEGAPDNSVIRRMREELRAAKREAAELRKQTAPAPIDVGEKPTLATCDFDEERFEAELDGWKDRKRQADEQQTAQQREAEEANKSWTEAQQQYEGAKAKLAIPDFADAEIAVNDALGPLSAVILKASVDPAKVVYALGKSPAKLGELAKLKDPFKIAAAVARMEGSISMTRRTPPKPDTPPRGAGAMPGSTDKELERLQKEADKTGDRTKVAAFKAARNIK